MIVEVMLLISVFLLYWHLNDKRIHEGYPPGPPRFPIVGSLPFFFNKSSVPAKAFEELAKKYGDIMFIRAGKLEAVVFTSYDSVVEILNHENAVDRAGLRIPFVGERSLGKNLGILWANGKSYQVLRRFTLRTLREFGFGKTHPMDVVINEELDKFIKHTDSLIESSPNGILRFDGFFDLTVVNILWRLVTGVNYTLDDPKMLHLLRINNDISRNLNLGFDFSLAFPFIWNLFPKFSGRDQMRIYQKEIQDFAWDTISEHRAKRTLNPEPNGFVDCFLEMIDQPDNDNASDSPFNDEQLLLTILDLFQAGAETTSKTLGFAVLYMLLNQNIQERVQAEIDSVVIKDCPISLSMKPKLPYCQAAVLETLRYSSVAPFPAFRAASADFYYRGYFIRKGTALMANLQSIHFNEKIWGDPNVFRPDRFLRPDGSIDTKVADFILPFGIGKRICLGKSLAETNIFLYFTTLLRQYKFEMIPGQEKPSIEPVVGITNAPKPFNARVIKRTL